ncbi:MBL fold metallo-hydrolase [Acidipila sp. EB88]|uniref:MBL fold metallo-hydrolase n=1 Tax=Acidipila sp. EB88 TaxID=2305226 RepID=UPI000F5EB4EE|nr:MBL fold metallo-hydrolase [Acidipila sp. EB88]RRA47482.1 MBL fold metallo-hydrolase [Acidipila sp. EB88]
MGVPILGCTCATCSSADPRDTRTRPSIAVRWPASAGNLDQHCVVIDTGPEFRMQALREQIRRIDAVFYTHAHADHILGLDDLRPLSFRHRPGSLPLYADDETAVVLERIFDYTFSPASPYPNKARVAIQRIEGEQSIAVADARFQRVPLWHGRLPIAGYRFGSAAYLTDMSQIPDASLALLRGVDVVILDALRYEPHPSHANVEEAIGWIERIGAKRAFFTHMSHELAHAATEATLPAHIRLCYDGQQIPVEL